MIVNLTVFPIVGPRFSDACLLHGFMEDLIREQQPLFPVLCFESCKSVQELFLHRHSLYPFQ
jgi:hypothetical protein